MSPGFWLMQANKVLLWKTFSVGEKYESKASMCCVCDYIPQTLLFVSVCE